MVEALMIHAEHQVCQTMWLRQQEDYASMHITFARLLGLGSIVSFMPGIYEKKPGPNSKHVQTKCELWTISRYFKLPLATCVFAICPCRTAAASANGSRPEMVYGSEEDERDTWRPKFSRESWLSSHIRSYKLTCDFFLFIEDGAEGDIKVIINDLEGFWVSLWVLLERFLSSMNTRICA